MTDGESNAAAGVTAGDWLRATREAEGLSIDAVAQQLKLAPRQVRAIEDGNYAELPGRTFVRGFVRNYARLLRLDPEAVVAALPGVEAAPALEGPAIGSASRPMGELPVTQASRGSSWSRWAIPIALVAAVIVAAGYEFLRPGASSRGEPKVATKGATPDPVAPPPGLGTPLPNPITGPEPPKPEAPADAPGTPATDASPALPPAAPGSDAPVAGTPGAPATGATPAPTAGVPVAGEAVLVIQYRKSAWTQVKDAGGQVLLVTNGELGGSQTVRGKPPFDVIIGNAGDATVTWRGQPFDLAPHTKGNVARARLD